MAWVQAAIAAAQAVSSIVGSHKSGKAAAERAGALRQLSEKAANANPWYTNQGAGGKNNFDEAAYFAANPDVAQAAKTGKHWDPGMTAWDHYQLFGKTEIASGARASSGQAPGWDDEDEEAGGAIGAGRALTETINMPFAPFDDDLENDPQYLLAQKAAAATSSTQPGGFSAMAASNAAMQTYGERRGQHQNLLALQSDRIRALSTPAGASFNPAGNFQVAGNLQNSAAQLESRGLASKQYGVNQGLDLIGGWLDDWLDQDEQGGGAPNSTPPIVAPGYVDDLFSGAAKG